MVTRTPGSAGGPGKPAGSNPGTAPRPHPTYAVPYDLLASALDVQPPRLRGIVARWRRAGYAQTGTLGPGQAWCWLTPAGMSACGLSYPAREPALSRLAHIRAVLAARLWLESGQAYRDGQAWWRSERRIRAALPSNAGAAHLADAEICWPSTGGPYSGQTWAVEVELSAPRGALSYRPRSGHGLEEVSVGLMAYLDP